MLGRLQHPGIAQVYAFSSGRPRRARAPGDGARRRSADHRLRARRTRLSIAGRASTWSIKLADAVQHAHDRGIIHRDLKPANVLVADGGQPKVLDFGIARATGADVQRITVQTAHGQLMGTLAYMSPEQLRGRSAEVDAPQRRLRARRAALPAARRSAAVRCRRPAVARGDPADPRTIRCRSAHVNPVAGPLEHVASRAMRTRFRSARSRCRFVASRGADGRATVADALRPRPRRRSRARPAERSRAARAPGGGTRRCVAAGIASGSSS